VAGIKNSPAELADDADEIHKPQRTQRQTQSFTKILATDLPTGRQVSRINTD